MAWFKSKVNTANLSSFCILLLVWTTFCDTFYKAGGKSIAPAGEVAATVALDVALFILFTLLSFFLAWPPPPIAVARKVLRLTRPDVVAVVICGATKTVALGVPLINVMYKGNPYGGVLSAPLIIYHALQILLGGLMLGRFRVWCEAGAVQPAAAAVMDADVAVEEQGQQQQYEGKVVGASTAAAAVAGDDLEEQQQQHKQGQQEGQELASVVVDHHQHKQ